MRRYNDGMIYTNDRCVACNHCVHVCPAVGANVSANDGGRISIDVSGKNCIHCGRCIKECAHGARQYKDSLPDLLKDLERGASVSLLVDPTFLIAYGQEKAGHVFGYLKSLGIKGIYDASFGADISMFCHIDYLKKNADENGKCDKFFSHTCPGFSNFVSRYSPGSLEKFIPVQLPAVCAAIYYRKYRNVKERFALLSPCTAVLDEYTSFSTGRNINYLIGFSSLFEHIGDTDISGYESGFDEKVEGCGAVTCENGAFSSIVSGYFPSNALFRTSVGIDRKLRSILSSTGVVSGAEHPAMVTIEYCRTGCIDGPAIDPESINMGDSIPRYAKVFEETLSKADDPDMSPNEKYAALSEKFSFINTADFMWKGEEDFHQMRTVPENVVEEIFASMHKSSEEKKHTDCQACGYVSCHEMVCAVANGYSRIEDCVHYLNDELKIQLGMDSLTGLFNQRGFFKAVTAAVTKDPQKKYILAIGDINGLGGINDLYGNTGGDKVITYVAKIMEEFAGSSGICSRFGSGTFAVLFENTPDNIARFKNETCFSLAHLDMEYPLSVKFGLYEMNDITVPVGRAALYATYAYRTSTDRSRNTYTFYSEEMSKSMYVEAEVTQKMKSAMRKKQFVLFLQPKYDHTDNRLVGAEVLSRWINDDGMISPAVFIPVFEKNGYITELDRYVWKTSYEMVDAWLQKFGTAVPVSVNISRVSLMDDSNIRYIEKLDKKYRSAKKYIQYEITESAYAGDTDEVFERVRAIRKMGYKINMDDFGSGYSSLNLLKDAPIDIVKLDMGFLRGNANMDRGNVIISAVVNMTKELGFDLVAEGVETAAQANLLCGMGCNVIQGFYYSKPVPESEFIDLLNIG